MHTRRVMTAACLVSAGLLFATPGAHADDGSTGVTTSTRGAEASSDAGAPHTATARAGAVTLGQIATTSPVNCTPGPTTMVQNLEGGAPSYVAGFTGVITSYSVRAGTTPGLVRLVVFGPHATPGHRTVVALSAQSPVTISTVNTFPARVPMAAGQLIGLNNSASGMTCWGAGVAGDQLAAAVFDPATSTDYSAGATVANSRVNISAVLEPDIDGDQFGDVTQDLCPQSKLTQAACPAPDTTVTKKPKKKSATRKAKIKFSSTIAGSTFTCAVDGKAAKPCTSPFKKKVKVGKHTVVITAVSPFGIVDPTPAKVKFKVVQQGH